MFDADKWQEILATLRKNKLRTALTAAGVFWGILMLIFMLGVGYSLETGVRTNLTGFSANTVYMWGQRSSIPYKGMQPGRPTSFTNEDIPALLAVEGMEHLAPRASIGGHRGGANVVRNNKTGNFSVSGDYPAIEHIKLMKITRGRFLNDLDMRDRRKVAVIGQQVYDVLFEQGGDPLGQHIKVQGVFFQIVGTFNATGNRSERDNQTVYVPFTTFQQAFNSGNRVGWFAMTAKPNVSAEDLENRVRAAIAARHRIHPDDTEAVGSFNAAKEFGKMTSLFTGINVFLWLVGIMTLLAGVLGVSNIMLIVVKERTKEIGIRKALGATPSSIVSLVIQESIALTTLAGWLGVVCGVGIIELIGAFIPEGGAADGAFVAPQVDVSIVLIASAILIVAGGLAGIIPATQAASVEPVAALRAE